MLRGVEKLANAVAVTMGPTGRNVIIDKSFGGPTVTKDGVTVSKEVELENRFENMGAKLVNEVASKTSDIAGDGTTTATVLARAIFKEGTRLIAAGSNPMAVRRGIEKAVDAAVEKLRSMSKPVSSKEEIAQVGAISANNDRAIGDMIANAMERVGKDGVITVEEGKSTETTLEFVEGMQFDKGYLSPYFINRPAEMDCQLENAYILIHEKKIGNLRELVPVLEQVMQTAKPLLIIAEDVEGEALATFVVNKLRGGFNVLAVKSPGYGDRKKEQLQDIAITVGAKLISEELGIKLENADLSALGKARKIIATKDSTIIVGGKGKKSDIEARIVQLKKQKEQIESKYDIEKVEGRIAKLSGGVAVIRVGAATETEMKYLKLKIEDAVNATKAAIEEGIVAGGGVALIRAAHEVEKSLVNKPFDKLRASKNMTKEQELGYRIVIRALSAPARQIAINAGKDDGSVIVDKIKNGKGNIGYDALKDEMVPDMISAGIVDPVKVTRLGVENACSAAAILLTTEAAIADEPEEKKNISPGGVGDMGY